MNEYFTLQSLLTFGGATAVVTLAPTVVAYLVGEPAKPYLKWVACIMAFGLAFLGAAVSGPSAGGAGPDWTRWVVAAVNGLVLFMAAVGANQLTAERATARVIGEPTGVSRARQSWL